LVVISYKNIKNIRFPVYVLPSKNWSTQDGLVYIDNYIVDDKNVKGESLGLRRLKTPFHKKLLPLKRAVTTVTGLLKQTSDTFIDSNGATFIYEKTKFVPVRYLKIKKVDKRIRASALTLEGVKTKFLVKRPPPAEVQWAGVIYLHGYPWVLYEYSECKKPDARRKI
jgi:hypothetical protein